MELENASCLPLDQQFDFIETLNPTSFTLDLTHSPAVPKRPNTLPDTRRRPVQSLSCCISLSRDHTITQSHTRNHSHSVAFTLLTHSFFTSPLFSKISTRFDSKYLQRISDTDSQLRRETPANNSNIATRSNRHFSDARLFIARIVPEHTHTHKAEERRMRERRRGNGG